MTSTTSGADAKALAVVVGRNGKHARGGSGGSGGSGGGGGLTSGLDALAVSSSSDSGASATAAVASALTRGTVTGVQRLGHTANRGVATVSRYLGRTSVARAAAATFAEVGRYASDRTREALDQATLRLAKAGRKPPPPENGWGDVGRRLGSISAYELQLIDEKVRDVGLVEFADMLGIKDPGELLRVAELRQRAAKGDEEAQYALAARFCPPPFKKRERCRKCHRAFGVTRYRHHCRHCGESFCQDHSAARHAIPKMGYLAPARVCQGCKAQLEEEDLKDRIVWRMVRLEAAVGPRPDRLIPYFHPGDETQWDRCLRAVGSALRAVPPLQRATSALAGEALEMLGKHGLAGMAGVLLRREFVEAVEVLKEVAGVDRANWPVSVPQLEAAMYYLLAKGRGERGADPEAEHEAHRTCPPVSDSLLQELLGVAPLALHFAYAETPVQMQLQAQQQGWRLVFAHPQQHADGAAGAGAGAGAGGFQPAFALYTHLREKEACLAVRGPDRVQEVLPELRGLPLPFPHDGRQQAGGGKGGWAQLSTEWQAAGAVGEAGHWLFAEVYPHLKRLLDAGYSLTLTGHSLGGAVAALLGVLLREEGVTEGVRCVGFGTPSCVNARLAQACGGFGAVLILHDDVVPRVTPSGVRGLLRDLLQEKDAVAQHWKEDVEAIIVKRQGKWAPRWRRLNGPGAGAGAGGAKGKGRGAGGKKGRAGARAGGVGEDGGGGSFVRSEEEEEEGAGTEAGRYSASGSGGAGGEGGAGGGEGANNEGWDSCDDDFVDYWGVGCLRPEALAAAGGDGGKDGGSRNPNSYSIRHEDGTTTTVDLSEARRRLLAGVSSSSSSPAAPPPPPPPPAPPSFKEEREEEQGAGSGFGGFGATILGRGDDYYGSEEEEEGGGGVYRRRGEEEDEGEDSGGLLPFGGEEEGEEEDGGRIRSPRRSSSPLARRRARGEKEEGDVEEEEGGVLFPMFGGGGHGRFGGGSGSEGEEEELLEEDDAAALPFRRPAAASDDEDEEGAEGEEEAEGHGGEGPAARKEKERELTTSSSSSAASAASSGPAAAAAARLSPAAAADEGYAAEPEPEPEPEPDGLFDDYEEEEEEEEEEAAEEDEEEEEECVLVEEGGLPELYPPGRIVHVYAHRGVYRACMPPRDFAGLRRIALQGNLLRDHSPKQYFDGLCEVIDARRAPASPPPWEGFKEKDACACCAVDLTWRWGAASEAQRYRDKHNCRCCGRLVCEGCSQTRKALPSIGLSAPARVCDRCVLGGMHSATGAAAAQPQEGGGGVEG